eukprot:Skav218842  [mRNA]  locus=scaffold3958:12972:18404:+ [translate_table: standard]
MSIDYAYPAGCLRLRTVISSTEKYFECETAMPFVVDGEADEVKSIDLVKASETLGEIRRGLAHAVLPSLKLGPTLQSAASPLGFRSTSASYLQSCADLQRKVGCIETLPTGSK